MPHEARPAPWDAPYANDMSAERLRIDVYDGDGQAEDVAMWCAELRLHGYGPDYASCHEDLVAEILLYADDFLGELDAYRADPTRRHHEAMLRRARELGPDGIAREMLGPFTLAE